MLTLYSYPTLFGVADNNGYGLKVFAFLRLAGVPFRHEHIFDASKAPRSQLPYIVDGNDIVGDSETILAYVTQKYRLTIDAGLTPAQRTTNLLITRMSSHPVHDRCRGRLDHELGDRKAVGQNHQHQHEDVPKAKAVERGRYAPRRVNGNCIERPGNRLHAAAVKHHEISDE